MFYWSGTSTAIPSPPPDCPVPMCGHALLAIDFRRRETFAYACEAYSRICECGAGPHARRQLLADLDPGTTLADDRVDAGEYLDILGEAVAARNGWKRILARCAAPRPVRAR